MVAKKRRIKHKKVLVKKRVIKNISKIGLIGLVVYFGYQHYTNRGR